jgi:hypothetical protein
MTTPLYAGQQITVEQSDEGIDVTVVDEGVIDVVVESQSPAVIEFAYEGPQGPPGQRGEVGPTGPPGGAYLHSQVLPAQVWLVQHSLGFRPGGFVVTDADGNDVEALITHASENATLLTFFSPTAGTATVS